LAARTLQSSCRRATNQPTYPGGKHTPEESTMLSN
jgi:hypothetical protein